VRLPALAGLLGAGREEVRHRIGRPAAERRIGDHLWQRFEGDGWSLRVRTDAGGRVASWTLALAEGAATLRQVAEPTGLWPACAPDGIPEREPVLRRHLPDPSGGPDRTLTATVRGGRLVALTAFDEPPDWEPPGAG